MKKNLLFIAAASLLLTRISAQTIPNNGFENWTSMGNYSDPDNWHTLNSIGAPLSAYTVTQGTPGAVGNYYLKITSKTAGPGVIPGLATTGTINSSNQTVSGGYPFTGRPASLTGKWQYMAMSAGDQGEIAVVTTKWNTVTNSRDTISKTQYMLPGMVMAWGNFSIPLTYVAAGFPDTCLIILASSTIAPANNSYLWVDNLSFTGWVGINENEAGLNKLNLFPDPAQDILNVTFSMENFATVKLQLMDISGKLIQESIPSCSLGENTVTMNLEGVDPGIYFVRFITDKGIETRKVIVE
jgi:hypothetical protein